MRGALAACCSGGHASVWAARSPAIVARVLHPELPTARGATGTVGHRQKVQRRGAREAATRAASAGAADLAAAAAPPPPAAHFSALPVDRAAHLRKQPERLAELLHAPRSLLVAFHGGKALVAAAPPAGGDAAPGRGLPAATTFAAPGEEVPDGGPPSWVLATWHPSDPTLQSTITEDPGLLFLGLTADGAAAVFACDLGRLPAEVDALCSAEAGEGDPPAGPHVPPLALALVDVRGQGQRMAGGDAAVLALAAGLLSWHRAAAYCGRTGAPTAPEAGGHARRAPPAGAPRGRRPPRAVYPRVDPAVIVAVATGDYLLLGRKASWEEGRYSLLAGFAEAGETLEAAAAREVAEESGVALDPGSCRYHSSQPWPFPQSLMIGFLAEAPPAGAAGLDAPRAASNSGGAGEGQAAGGGRRRGLEVLSPAGRQAAQEAGLRPDEAETWLPPAPQAVRVDVQELQDARWFHRDWLRAALAGSADGGGATGAAFRVPGRYALANAVISDWLAGRACSGAGPAPPSGGGGGAWSGDALPAVKIDAGVFKYVLIRVSGDGGRDRLIVRGDRRAPYHNDVLQAARAEALGVDARLRLEPVGGGRMEHRPEERAVSAYGYSAAFGPAPHDVTAALLRRWLPFHDVAFSYDGY
jgi:ADP-ribose pyrophosphatase YjhB (NUDIX family)